MFSSTTIARTDTRLAKLKARRKLWLDVHLYIGLIAGAVLAVVGLTGSFAVFFVELQEVLNPELAIVSTPVEDRKKLHSLNEIVAAAESVKPQGSRFFKVYYPRKPDIAYKLLYFVRDDKQAKNGDGYYIFVDPYTAKVNGVQLYYLKDSYWGRPIVGFIMQLHWCLLQGRTGADINGILAAISVVSVLTGLILWWPLTGKFKQALTFKRNASAVRFNFDLHKTLGFYSAIVLLPVLFSGIYFNLPEQVNVLVNLFSPVSRPTAFNSIPMEIRSKPPQAGQQALSLSTVEAIVQQHYPAGRLWMLLGPKNPTDVYKVMKRDVTELSRFIGYRDIAVDQYSGEIGKVYDKNIGSSGDRFLDWQWPLHSGYAFGWTGRMLVFFSGLVCPILYVTGVIRWLQKRRAKRAKVGL
ncbi:PepSY-associated TM helix domain-containing protein [Methylomonas methanica]|uniref:PepSY-associated TM helix domain protein n=1 Tax=Methylomonas methanica (strain DSM 25384 / MC09) TaxID=857087 RepID=G0A120_METMM|nr:PepSY-associated TM helix domain-containing protein [Methylomonas methanica]AEG01276.1 PepSY-associated TM helix domain protein [Methylomonas methanica MC09]